MSSPDQNRDTHIRLGNRNKDTHEPPELVQHQARQDSEQDQDTHTPPPAQDPDTHIASFIVQHRDSAADALGALIAAHPDLELALPSPTRSIVICESADRHAVMQRVDQLQALPGVLNVLLVYHHAEPAPALAEPLATSTVTPANGATS